MIPNLGHAFARELPELAAPTRAASVSGPQTVLVNEHSASDLGFESGFLTTTAGAGLLTGTELPEGAQPVAQLYAGHQFGSFSPMLGDGRALLLGEIDTVSGERVDLHLKGTGPTAVSRGDGFATLEATFREFLVSEAMHALGIPTTRALAVTLTGHTLFRPEGGVAHRQPGAVIARTAASHIRVGSFQLARMSRDPQLLKRLAGFAIARHDPDLVGKPDAVQTFFSRVVERQANLVAQWMLTGFVHGVMNTDNMLVSGATIDYGPCAFLDTYQPEAVFSSIDHRGRYAYAQQPRIAAWNLARLGDALLPILDADEARATGKAEDVLAEFDDAYVRAWCRGAGYKLGLPDHSAETVGPLAEKLYTLMRDHDLDHTLTWRALTDIASDQERTVHQERTVKHLEEWVAEWRAHHPDAAVMRRHNPIYIPRNHHLHNALQAAVQGSYDEFSVLLQAVTDPFTEHEEAAHLAQAGVEATRPFVTFCGT